MVDAALLPGPEPKSALSAASGAAEELVAVGRPPAVPFVSAAGGLQQLVVVLQQGRLRERNLLPLDDDPDVALPLSGRLSARMLLERRRAQLIWSQF